MPIKPTIYADHAATTALSPRAYVAMQPFLTEHFANASQPYALARPCRQALQEARAKIATCLHAEPEEIFFTSGGTESDNWALKASMISAKNHLITCPLEHHAILRCAQWLKLWGCRVSFLPVDSTGKVLTERLSRFLRRQTALVSVMLVNNEIGTIQDLATLSAIAHRRGVPVHTDAVQALGHIPVDVRTLGVDLLSASAHKFNGPKGIGFLFKRHGIELPSLLQGGSQEYGLRAGTENIAAIVGMATALEENCQRLADYAHKMTRLEELFIDELRHSATEFRINGPSRSANQQSRLPGLLSVSFPGYSGEQLLHLLDLQGICISTGSACDSRTTQISHVLKAIKLPRHDALGTIRLSFGYENTPEEIKTIAAKICQGLTMARKQ